MFNPVRSYRVRLFGSSACVVALSLLATGCTSVDQTFGLDESDLSLAAAPMPKADLGSSEPSVASVQDNAEEEEDIVASAASEAGEIVPSSQLTVAVSEPVTVASAVPVPSADVASTAVAPSGATAPPVLALRETPEKAKPFGFLRNTRKAKAAAEPSRRTPNLDRNVAALATAKSGVKSSETRRQIKIIRPSSPTVLPGVRSKASIFGIAKGKAEDGAFRVASAAGLARGGGGGSFVKQTPKVSTECFKPDLVRALQRVERKFGSKVVVTSGFRSPKHNRRAGGAKRSKHMTCEAADIQVPGVSKAKLAAYLRSMPNRGGVGTYCHTQSVHYDIGSQRDWSWGCRRR